MHQLHPQLAKDCTLLAEAELCSLLLMNDANYPWCILVPRREGVSEIYQMSEADQQQLMRESSLLAAAMMQAFRGDKMNIGALGNMVPQLHIHHIVRYRDDPAWPAPVWGRLPVVAYDDERRRQVVDRLKAALDGGFRFVD
jgi:diadenosine tetraphosphate (Ap4A) HIT family hydrolase